MLKGKNLVTPDDLTIEEINILMDRAKDIIKSPSKYSNICNGRVMGALFF